MKLEADSAEPTQEDGAMAGDAAVSLARATVRQAT